MREIPPRSARTEAETRLGDAAGAGTVEVRVLEPSPPAVDAPPFFADDPAVRGDTSGRVVSPIDEGPGVGGVPRDDSVTWDSLAAEDPELRAWCAERWLGGWDRLAALPAGYAESTAALRRLAVYVLAPARREANTKIGLRYTIGGFGTPFYGNNEQVRIDDGELVRQLGDQAWSTPVGTLMEAADFAGVKLTEDPGVGHDLPGLGAIGRPLPVTAETCSAAGAWFGFGTSILEQLRFELRTAGAPVSRVQLWPEHFDLSFDNGTANLGFSPGDTYSPEPYAYFGPWNRDGLSGGYWNAPFGASLPYSAVLAADDQRAAVIDFLREGLAATMG